MSVVAVAFAEEAAKPAAVLPAALPLGYGLGHLGYGYGAYPYAHAIAAPVAQPEITLVSRFLFNKTPFSTVVIDSYLHNL